MLPPDRPLDRLRVGIDQELGRVVAQAACRVIRAVHSVAVPLARADLGKVAVPVVRGPLGQLDASLTVAVVEETELDAVGVLGEAREVRARPGGRRAERKRVPGPQVHRLSSAVSASKSATSSTSPRLTRRT